MPSALLPRGLPLPSRPARSVASGTCISSSDECVHKVDWIRALPLHTQGQPSGVEANGLNDRSVVDSRTAPGALLITTWYGGPNNGVGLVVESLAQSLHQAGASVAVLELLGDGWLPRT